MRDEYHTYRLVQYSGNQVAGEWTNVAVLVFAPDRVLMQMLNDWSRFVAYWSEADAESVRDIVTDYANGPRDFLERPHLSPYSCVQFGEILPFRGDPEDMLPRLFARLVNNRDGEVG